MQVTHIGVIGAGIMGRGIAQVASLGGYQTTLQDLDAKQLQVALENIKSSMGKAIEKNKISVDERDQALNRLHLSTELAETCKDAQMVIEAIPEKIELKLELLGTLDQLCSDETILASNTSSLSITEMAAATHRATRVLGMHFFNPVPRMKLLEIVQALETSEEAIATAKEVGKQMGKEPVVVRESPGFVTSRINAMIGNEAFRMLEEGVASAKDIDKALKLGLNHPMGPFELVDLVGLDTRLAILQYLHQSLGERFRPSPLLVQHVKAGRLGRKSGRGVYDYE